MHLHFTRVALQWQADCESDWLAVFDGPASTAPLVARFCDGTPPPLQSSGTSMHVVLHRDTNGQSTATGFAAEYIIGE